MDDDTVQRTRNVGNQFDQLASVRSQITSRNISVLQAIDIYSEAFDNTVRLLSTLVNIDDLDVFQKTNGVLYMYWARDFLLREDLLITSLHGRLKPGGRVACYEFDIPGYDPVRTTLAEYEPGVEGRVRVWEAPF